MTPTVISIHVAKARRLPMQTKDLVEIEAGKGIVGDRHHGTKHRHVTVQSRESLDEAAAALGRDVPSHLTRRNITISHGAVPREALRRRAGTVCRVLEGGTITVGDEVVVLAPAEA